MSDKFFLDTNVLVYMFDPQQPDKRRTATDLVDNALRDQTGLISYQVVQECLNVLMRKAEIVSTQEDARDYLVRVLAPLCKVFASIKLYDEALALKARYKFSFYDSVIVAGALAGGCETLFTEDLHHGQQVGGLTIVNPFADG